MHRMEKVFSIWPTAAALARDIGESEITVRAWKRRMSIPANRDLTLIAAAKRRGHELTLEDLAALRRAPATRNRREGRG